MPNRTVFAVASAKGGVGKTTTSINIGTSLAGHDLDVVVVELDLAMANVVDFLSLAFDDGRDPSMHDVLAGDVPVTDALYEAPGGATVAPSGTSLDALGSLDMNNLSTAIETLRDRFDVVVLDTGAGVNSATTTAIRLADETILVSTPRVASIRDTDKTRTIVEERGGEVGGLVLTQSGTGSSPGSQRLTEFLGVDLLCTVPQDDAIHESQDAGAPVVERRPDSDAARAYLDGANALVEGGLGGEPASASEPQPAEGSTANGPSRDEQAAATERAVEEPPDEAAEVEPTRAELADELVDEPEAGGTGTPPSKESLEAQGWTFPGEIEDAPETAEEPEMEDVPELVGVTEIADGPTMEREPEDDAGDVGIDVGDRPPRDRELRPLTADGGETSLPDDAYGPASPHHVDVPTPQRVDVPSPADRLPEELRSATEEAETDETDADAEGDDGDDDAPSNDSLAGRVFSFLSRSE